MAPPANTVQGERTSRFGRSRSIECEAPSNTPSADSTTTANSSPQAFAQQSMPQTRTSGAVGRWRLSHRRSATHGGEFRQANIPSEDSIAEVIDGSCLLERANSASDPVTQRASDINQQATTYATPALTPPGSSTSLSVHAETLVLEDSIPSSLTSSLSNSLPSSLSSGLDSSSSDDDSLLAYGQLLRADNEPSELQPMSEFRRQACYLKLQDRELKQQKKALKQQLSQLKDGRRQVRAQCKINREQLAKIALEQGGGPKNWGMSVQQLIDFMEDIKPKLRQYCCLHRRERNTYNHVCLLSPCNCNHGCAKFRAAHRDEDATLLPNVEPTMHTVVDLFVKPATLGAGGVHGYALKLNKTQPKTVQKFISHSWSGRFEDFVETLKRNLLPEAVVFICSFALPQNMDLNALLSNDLEQTPFAVAHKVAEEVCLVIDESVDVIERAWVIYELNMSLRRGKNVHIALTKIGDEFHEKVMNLVQNVDVRRSKASKEADLKAIKAAVAGMEDTMNREIRIKLKEKVHQRIAESQVLSARLSDSL